MTADLITAAERQPLQIWIMTTSSGRKWRASLNGKTLCVSASPLIKSARILIAKGVDPNRSIQMWHQRANSWALRCLLGKVAATRMEGEVTPKKPAQKASNGPPMRFGQGSGTPEGEGLAP